MTRRRVLVAAAIGGALVKAGELLLRLESDELPAALAQTVSALIRARAELRRNRDLVTQGLFSPARLDEVRRSMAVAQSQQAVVAAANADPADVAAN